MAVVSWIVLGLVAGYLASQVVNRHGGGLLLDVFLGMVGAIVGGYLFQRFGSQGADGLNLWSLPVATAGSILLLLAYHAIRRDGWARR